MAANTRDLVPANLAALVDDSIALKLIELAPGLQKLAELSPSALKHLGLNLERGVDGGITGGDQNRIFHAGIIEKSTVLDGVSRNNRGKAVSKLANKVKLAVGADLSRASPDGTFGSQLRDEMLAIIAQLEAPPPGREEQPLPVPESDVGKKPRAGAKYQRLNGRFERTLIERKLDAPKFGVDFEVQKEEVLRSRDVQASVHAAKVEQQLKEQRIVANGGQIVDRRPANTAGKRGRDFSDLLHLEMKPAMFSRSEGSH